MYGLVCAWQDWQVNMFLLYVTLFLPIINTEGYRISYPVAKTVTHVPVIIGDEADLPCDTESSVPKDKLLFVVWYRDDNTIYGYDNRLSEPSGQWIDEPYAGRVQWLNRTAVLHINDTQVRDRATYRCRVEFAVGPTKNYLVALDVVELPTKPVIFDENGKVLSNIAGPYREGSEFKLICYVSGGYPIPRIQWLRGDTVLTALDYEDNESPSRSLVLMIMNATRAHLFTMYTCTANNTILTTPPTTSIKVDLFLKPLTVEIFIRDKPLYAGRKSDIWCKTTGSRPPANITWWLERKKIEDMANVTGTIEANETKSLIQWIPLKEHNGQVLMCRAEHSYLDNANIERKFLLDVRYAPEAKIYLPEFLSLNNIEEGDNVYLNCEIDANPPAYKVIWEHNGITVKNNPSKGVIVNTNLALRNVSHQQTGNYTCTASNIEGDSHSSPLHINILYKPLCQKKETQVIGVAFQEHTEIMCEVDAYPLPYTFEWTFNNSVQSIKINTDQFTVKAEKGISILKFKPMLYEDYGTLSCKATNSAGRQVLPCLYVLIPLTKPDPPFNCIVHNLAEDSLDVLCSTGYDGGLECVYVAEVWVASTLLVNTSNDDASWHIRKLGHYRRLRIKVYAANARGRSRFITLIVKKPLKPSRIEPQQAVYIHWLLGVLFGVGLIIGLLLCIAAIVRKIQRRKSEHEDATKASTKEPLCSAIAAPNVKACSGTDNIHRINSPVLLKSPQTLYAEIQNYANSKLHHEIVTTNKLSPADTERETCV